MDITVPEEDFESIEIPIGNQSTLSDADKAKWAEAMKLDEAPASTPAAPPLEQVTEPEITADDLPLVETPQVRKLKVALPDGEVELEESELVKGYMRQADYTRKTQEVARAKAEAEAMREAMQFYQQPTEPVYQPYKAPIGEPEFQTPTEKMLYDELQTVKGQVGSLAKARDGDLRQNVYTKIDSELNGFKESHPELNEEQLTQIITIANEEGTRPSKRAFERIYKAEFTDTKRIADEAVSAYIQTLREKKKAAVAPATEAGIVKPEPLDVRKLTDEQRRDGMLKELGF
jgi:hypothetical protein